MLRGRIRQRIAAYVTAFAMALSAIGPQAAALAGGDAGGWLSAWCGREAPSDRMAAALQEIFAAAGMEAPQSEDEGGDTAPGHCHACTPGKHCALSALMSFAPVHYISFSTNPGPAQSDQPIFLARGPPLGGRAPPTA